MDTTLINSAYDSFGFQWHITDRCNLRCRHCYQDGYSPDSEHSVANLLALAKKIFDTLPKAEIAINLTGGEPLFYPGIWELLDGLAEWPQLTELNLITNGTLIDRNMARRLAQRPQISAIKISVEGATKEENDAIRGTGHWQKLLTALDNLQSEDIPVILMMTLSAHNYKSIEAMADFAFKRGLSGIIYERFVPLGRGDAMSKMNLSPAQWLEVNKAIARAAAVEADPHDLLPFKAFWLDTSAGREDCELEGAECNLGPQSMALMPDGTVYPCRRLPVPVGNLNNQSFAQILAELVKYHPLNTRKNITTGICQNCPVEGCSGCRALVHALTGDFKESDPQCIKNL